MRRSFLARRCLSGTPRQVLAPFAILAAVFAATYQAPGAVVTNTNDSGPGSLREVITITPAGGTVDFALSGCPCTITLTSGELQIAKNLQIIGPGPHLLAISGNDTSRVFRVHSADTVLFEALSISRGRASGATPFDGFGGGMIVENTGITAPSVTIRNVSFVDNRAGFGGGIHFDGASVMIENSVFKGNHAVVAGGLRAGDASTVRIDRTTFVSNTASLGESGASFYDETTALITNSTFEGNAAGVETVLTNYISKTDLVNCTFSGNTGVGIYNVVDEYGEFPSTLTITSSTLIGNDSGYIVMTTGAETTVRNSIIAGNYGRPDVIAEGTGKFISEGYNLIGDRGAVREFSGPGDQAGTFKSRMDPLIEVLALNGASSKTHALKANSPARDRGNAFGTFYDQRGSTRPVDDLKIENAPGGDGSDIGAFESKWQRLSGRVTSPDGNGIRNAVISITDQSTGSRSTVIASSLGYYSFENLASGRSYILAASSKRFRFQIREVTAFADLSDIDLVGEE